MRPTGSWSFSFVRILWGAAATKLALVAFGIDLTAAVEVRVFSSGAPAEIANALGARFAETTGHRIVVTVATVGAIREKLSAAEKADVVILPTQAIEALTKTGALSGSGRAELARVGIGIAVRDGATLPDVSTAEAVRKMLVEARSIVHSDPLGGGFAGAHVARMMARLGVTESVTPKVTHMFAIGGGLAAVAGGDAEIGLYTVSEILAAKGVRLAGPLPPDLQGYITFSGALHGASASPDAALSFLRLLSDENAREAWQTRGFESLGRAP